MEFRQLQDSPTNLTLKSFQVIQKGVCQHPVFRTKQKYWDDTYFENGFSHKGVQLSLKGSKASICKKGSSGFGNGFINDFGSREIPRPPKPRHLAFGFGRSGWSFRVQIEVELVVLEGAMMTTSHFDEFKDKALSLANFPTIWICCWRDDKLLVTVWMSSA